ncbi:DUF1499 domain-containing protein [Psychromonas algicola]|uniref:DUF1499 domain-containing protein n=1 Tax=Psychromonas algicola TaxID=2555642 RepID=UPI001067F9CC|nr:DUF1499 domain-containing protein [Psychromonas sp. RZ5]TEW51902.1 DUF1499 domain-containing protein [Psychromonas sp. RZ5]
MSLLKRSKTWSSIILLASVICIAAIIVAIFGVRGEWIGIRTAFTTISYASQAAVPILLTAILILVLARGDLNSRIKSGLAVLLLLAPVINQFANQPEKTPPGLPLNDISTDTITPPVFDAVIAFRPVKSNTIEYPGASAAKRQTELFPDIQPIQSSLTTEQAFNLSLKIAENNDWDIVAKNLEQGIIEAVASTPVFSFEDDVVIRIQAMNSGSIIDIRSHSRIGRGDRGKNAQRVREFIKQFNQG